MFVFANVEFEPETPCGSLPLLSEKPPPARVDSAARESDATAPADSFRVDCGSLTYMNVSGLIVSFVLESHEISGCSHIGKGA